MPEENKAPHCYKPDPNEGKEDTRPVELKRRKPNIEIDWGKLKRWIEGK